MKLYALLPAKSMSVTGASFFPICERNSPAMTTAMPAAFRKVSLSPTIRKAKIAVKTGIRLLKC
jgi:hypothetical protein